MKKLFFTFALLAAVSLQASGSSAEPDDIVCIFPSATVRIWIATNSVPSLAHASEGWRLWQFIDHTRVMRYVVDGKTNEVTIKFLGTEMRKVEPPAPACSGCACCRTIAVGSGLTGSSYLTMTNVTFFTGGITK